MNLALENNIFVAIVTINLQNVQADQEHLDHPATLSECVCVCVCVCERERERWEREVGERGGSEWSSHGAAGCCIVAYFQRRKLDLGLLMKVFFHEILGAGHAVHVVCTDKQAIHEIILCKKNSDFPSVFSLNSFLPWTFPLYGTCHQHLRHLLCSLWNQEIPAKDSK